MNEEAVLELYGLDPDPAYREPIRQLLKREIEHMAAEDHELLRTLCVMLFCIGQVEDTHIIWQAKQKNQDAASYIDVQLLCGAGYQATVDYLERRGDPQAKQELKYLKECEPFDFIDFSKEEWVQGYKQYYGVT
ncbi:hypothetical protein [Paenibacillus hubeiensis]|uniref:hypothetical protein n=1 Tax=Paenibacillus hubeiensis TaxID=3077330 RepID=UPI0031BBB48E